jgi:hypothetical protein
VFFYLLISILILILVMKKICSFLTMFLLTVFSWGTASAAAALPTISPADGSGDAWYHIRLEMRTWGLYGNTGTTIQDGSVKGYYLDQGNGKLLMNTETVNIPGTRWKVVATAKEGEYQLISGLGNTIDFGNLTLESGDDRFYTTTLGSQVFTIMENNGDYLGLTLKGVGGIDKSNGNPYFGKYGPDAAGGAITFVPAEDLTEMYLIQPANLDLGDVPTGKRKIKTLTVTGINLTGNLNYSIAGAGFSVTPGATTASGGTAKITFAPTERKAYTAELTISIGDQSVKITLTGNADFEFPVQISENGGDEHWYYIQFDRQAVNNKVLQANQLFQPVTQALILGGKDKQLWKIVGGWDEYLIVNKEGELGYSQSENKYVLYDKGYGNFFGFDRFEDTDAWQVRNEDARHSDAPDKQYVNDLDSKGDSVSNYTLNDAGNRLIFIPATTHSLVVGLESVDFGTAPAGTGATVKKIIPVGGLNITGNISAEITGAGAAAFSLTSNTLPAAGGEFEVTFTPLAVNNYKAQLILKSEGVTNDTVQLTARGSIFPFKVSSSDNSNEHWYYIQFVRVPGKAFTGNGLGGLITQTGWTADQPVNDNQLWKITGTWDNYKFVSKKGGEFICHLKTDGEEDEYEHYTLAASGNRHIALEKTSGANTGWCFRNVEANEAGHIKYMNDNYGEEIGLYGAMDDGNPLNFISASGTSIIPSVTALGYGDVTTGLKSEKVLTVSGKQTTTPISYVLAGTGAAAFKIINTTAGAGADGPLPATGGTLKVSFEPTVTGDYMATLTLNSTGAEDVVIVLSGNCISFPEDFPVKISDATSTTWYTVYFKRQYVNSGWKVWSAGLPGETIKQVTHIGHEDPDLTVEEQLWKFVIAPSKTGYLAVSYNGLEATAGESYSLNESGEGTPLVFKKNPGKSWILWNDARSISLNDQGGNTVCEYSSDGSDTGCPMGFIETAAPAPVRIQISTKTVDFGKIEAGAPALYSNNVIVRGVGLSGDITLSVSNPAYSIVRAADSTAVANNTLSRQDTLKIIFTPAATQAYNATLTLTADGATTKTIALIGGGDLKLPAKVSTTDNAVWYYVSFERQDAKNKVLTVDGDTLRQTVKAENEEDAQLWKIEGNIADGYQLINKTGAMAAYDSTSTVLVYLMKAEGDRFDFVSGTGENAAKVQMRDLTYNTLARAYLCDKSNEGLYATGYTRNDAGNWMTFTPLIPDAIIQVDAEANDSVVSSAYYNLQGIRIQQPVRGNLYIRIDTHASGKTTATKIFLVK